MLEMIRDWIGESTEKEVCPECKEHPDCFAWVDGRCTALTRSDGRRTGRGGMDRSCGFYRAREGVREEGKQNYKRLKAVGRWDLIWKYHDTLMATGAMDDEMREAEEQAEAFEVYREEHFKMQMDRALGESAGISGMRGGEAW